MPQTKPKRRTRPLGIYVYCAKEERKRIDAARKFRHTTLTGYLLEAALRQVEADEAEMAQRQRRG